MEEKRKFQRKDTQDRLSLRMSCLDPMFWGRADTYDFKVNNLSLGGVAFETPSPLPPKVPLKLNLTFSDIDDYATVTVFARVVWAKKHNENYTMGVTFAWWNDDMDKKKIADFTVQN